MRSTKSAGNDGGQNKKLNERRLAFIVGNSGINGTSGTIGITGVMCLRNGVMMDQRKAATLTYIPQSL